MRNNRCGKLYSRLFDARKIGQQFLFEMTSTAIYSNKEIERDRKRDRKRAFLIHQIKQTHTHTYTHL